MLDNHIRESENDQQRRVLSGSLMLVMGLLLSFPGIPGPGILVAIAGLDRISPGNRVSSALRSWVQRFREWPVRYKALIMALLVVGVGVYGFFIARPWITQLTT